MINNLYNRFNDIKVLFGILLLTIYLAGITMSGGSIFEFALFWGNILVCILIPGRLFYQLLKLDTYFDEDCKNYSISTAIGIGFFCLVYAVDRRFNAWWIIFFLPILASVIYIYKNNKTMFVDVKKTVYGRNSGFTFLFLLYAFIMFIFTFLAVVKHAHPAVVGEITLSQDFMWTVGNAESFKMNLPPIDIRFYDVRLWYHYLTELIASGVSYLTSISSYNILGFYMQSFIMAFFITSAYDFAKIYYNKNIVKINLFIISFFSLSCLSLWKSLPNGASRFSNSLLQTLISNVNSQATAFAFLCVFLLMAINLIRKQGNLSFVYYVVAVSVFFLLIFSKSPIAAIVAIAMLCACIVSLFGKSINFKVIAFSGVIISLFYILYANLLSAGAEHSTLFHLTQTLELGYFSNYIQLIYKKSPLIYKLTAPIFMIIQTFCIAPFQFVVVVPMMFKDAFKLLKLSFEKLWFYACIAGGILAFYISYHEAFSQVYFLYVGIFFLNLLAVEYFDFSKINIKNLVYYILIGLSLSTSLFMYINFGGSGIRQFLFNYDILNKYPYSYIVKAEDELAGDYLRNNMDYNQMFITNRTHTGAGEGLSNVYTCFSGRQAYMEGFKYTVSNMGVSQAMVRQRLDVVGAIFGIYDQNVQTPEWIKQICQELSIPYIVYSSQFEGDTSSLENFEVVFNRGTVKIYKIY